MIDDVEDLVGRRQRLYLLVLATLEHLKALVHDDDPDVSLADRVADVQAAKEIVAFATELAHAAEARLAEAMPRRVVVCDEAGVTLTKGHQTRRIYEVPDLVAGRVRSWALEEWRLDHETGELRDLTGEVTTAAEAVTNALMKAARLEFRVGALKEMGIDPDRYSDVHHGRPTVQIQ